MNKLLLFISLIAIGCSSEQEYSKPDVFVCPDPIPADDLSKEDILVIGDSISIGYTATVKANLPQYEVVHNLCNGMTVVNGLTQVKSWLNMRPKWKMITFNHGLWDIVPFYNVPLEVYRDYLRAEAYELKRASDNVIFFTTTYVPIGTENRNNNDVIAYNQAAIEVMAELSIPVYDLYTESLDIPLADRLTPTDVHYTPAGYQILGDFVTGSMLDFL